MSVLILVYAIQRYTIAITNGPNHSEFSVGRGQLVRSVEFLSIALVLIGAYQYMAIGYKFGAGNANRNFF